MEEWGSERLSYAHRVTKPTGKKARISTLVHVTIQDPILSLDSQAQK